MKPANTDALAFPCGEDDFGGLTFREYAATHTLAGLLACSGFRHACEARADGDAEKQTQLAAAVAVKYADSLLAELSKPTP